MHEWGKVHDGRQTWKVEPKGNISNALKDCRLELWPHIPVMWVTIKITPLPDGSISPPTSKVGFSFSLELQEVGRKFFTISHVPHYIEKPVPHTARKVSHIFCRAVLHVSAHTVVFNVDMLVLLSTTHLRAMITHAAHLVDFTV